MLNFGRLSFQESCAANARQCTVVTGLVRLTSNAGSAASSLLVVTSSLSSEETCDFKLLHKFVISVFHCIIPLPQMHISIEKDGQSIAVSMCVNQNDASLIIGLLS